MSKKRHRSISYSARFLYDDDSELFRGALRSSPAEKADELVSRRTGDLKDA